MKFINFEMISYIRLKKGIGLLLLSISFFQNCYLNPVVNGILSPAKEEENNSFLGLLGITPSSFGITGQLKSNGVAVSGAVVKVINPTSDSATSNTDVGGRFYVIGKPGTLELQVDHSGNIFTIEILVMPPNANLVAIGNASYTVSNLETYFSTSDIPVYFDLVSSRPYDGLIITDSNYSPILGAGFYFQFSEDLETVGDYDLWRDQNFILSPTIVLGSVGVSPNALYIMVPMNYYNTETDYVLTLMPGIRSVSGKVLKQTPIRFRIESLPL